MDSRTSSTQPHPSTYSDATVSRSIRRTQWGRTKTGHLSITYSNMRQRTRGEHKRRYAGLDLLPRAEFMEWAVNDPTYTLVFDAWHEAGCPYRLTPSIDRIDNARGYTIDNIRFLTQSENSSIGMKQVWDERKATPTSSTGTPMKEACRSSRSQHDQAIDASSRDPGSGGDDDLRGRRDRLSR